jgi:hypothetical protein
MKTNTHKVVWISPNLKFPETDTGTKSKSYEAAGLIAQKLNRETVGSPGKYAVMLIMFMNPNTGSVDDYLGWDYENQDGESVNAAELGEVVEVIRNSTGEWVEANNA